MNTESLCKIYQEITKDPIKGIFIIIFAFIVTIVSWYISSYIKEKAKIRAMSMIALLEPPMIGVMEPFQKSQKAILRVAKN